jgi:hypothetical protein
MGYVIEHLKRGPTVMRDAVITWTLENEGVAIDDDPTRLILLLKEQETEELITIDTNEAAYSLGLPGTTENFRFDGSLEDGQLTIDLGGLPLSTFPAGRYDADLIWYDSTYTNGLPWGNDVKEVVIHKDPSES